MLDRRGETQRLARIGLDGADLGGDGGGGNRHLLHPLLVPRTGGRPAAAGVAAPGAALRAGSGDAGILPDPCQVVIACGGADSLRDMRGDQLRKINQNGMLPLIYAHLFSLQLMREIFETQVSQGKGPIALPAAPQPAEA